MKNSSVTCNCILNGGQCHIYTIRLTEQDLSGVLPRSLAKLPYLKDIVLFRNFLSGTIPREWATMKLEFVSISQNRLSWPVPSYLGNIATLRVLSLEDNLFSGTIPPELGKLVNMETLILNPIYLTGELPPALANLVRMKFGLAVITSLESYPTFFKVGSNSRYLSCSFKVHITNSLCCNLLQKNQRFTWRGFKISKPT
ncbi:probable leucine-rich repeat receptor-like serine/threonine-protein kinase At3g14840 isoform X1 [Hibiscus syriacus]|uniref:probable leucine-rich repeat receptor-like serine/threonine-protein kinase At3g14840 isoform X1 n=1 Tax=Hibiscus syriacus TaxID=106335 RepID=UPI0019209BD6|nr:probable leucine-rich repeat receptor-like serine/threonine-protein kinase At3g14840 isoform X1 [Hibiscus syriacus]